MVEFALVLPVLLLVVCGIIDLSRLFYGYQHLHHASQETVRLGGLGRSDTEMTTFARNYFHLGKKEELQIKIEPTGATRKSGQYVTVTLTYSQPFVTPVISKLAPAPVITVHSTIRVE